MKPSIFGLFVVLTSLAFVACGGGRTGSAVKNPDGSAVAFLVHFDRGITADMTPERVDQMQQIATWMEDDLLTILQKTGYAASRTEDPNVQAGPGRYVLRVKIKNYNAGSKAARMLVGFGAGAAVLDTHFELVGDGGALLISGDPSVGSGRDWKNSARKVNLQTVDAVNARLHQK
jgi:hypothetical protein